MATKAKGAQARSGLAAVLVARGVLTPEQAEAAQRRQQETGRALARVVVEMGLAPEEDIVRAVAAEQGYEFVDLHIDDPDPSAATLIDGSIARRHGVIPVGFDGDRLRLAMADPRNADAVQEVSLVTGLEVVPAYATRPGVEQAIARVYGSAPGSEEPAPAPAGAAAPEPVAAMSIEPPEEPGIKRVGQRLGVGDDDVPLDIHELLEIVVDRGGSDLHLTAGVPPVIRVHGALESLADYPVFKPQALQKILYGMLTQKQRERLESDLELDCSYAVPGKARFRVNVYLQRGALGAAFRLIPFEIKSVDSLGLPPQVGEFAKLPRGLVVVTGPTGSGKSTTLAAIVDLVNRSRPVHIMTVEDPIEFLHNHKTAVVNQREVGEDTLSFAQALKHVLRQDPDVILVGEMRDLETIHMAITAAETGHLVFGTLHTQDAPQTIDRIIDVFPPHQQQQVRVQLAGSLQAVVAQQLIPTRDGKGRAAACEILVATPAVRNLIREAKVHQIYSIMQAGGQFGMQTMDAALGALVNRGVIGYEAGLEKCHHADEFARLTGGGAGGSSGPAAPREAAGKGLRARVIG